MGLDMYLYKIERVTKEEKKYYVERDGDVEDVLSISEDEIGLEMYKDLAPYAEKVVVNREYINLAKFMEDNNIPETAYIAGEHYSSDGTAEFIFRYGEDFEDRCEIEVDYEEFVKNYSYTQADTVYIVKYYEVGYWRKAYDTRHIIYAMIDRNVENCGYYKLSPLDVEDLATTNEEIDDLDDFEDIFYHEWY